MTQEGEMDEPDTCDHGRPEGWCADCDRDAEVEESLCAPCRNCSDPSCFGDLCR